MKKAFIAVLTVIGLSLLLAVCALAQNQNEWPWNKISFSGNKDYVVSRMLLEMNKQNGTLTAYLLMRDTILWNQEKGKWEKYSFEKRAFTSYVQSKAGHFEDVIEALYWASDQTGWGVEAPNWLWHNNTYKYAYYVGGETVNVKNPLTGATKTFWRRKVIFVIQGIPLPPTGGIICAQFLLRYKNGDGSFDYVWLNPAWLDKEDLQKYWVPDLLTPDGLVIRGKFDANGNFIKVPKTSPQ